MTDSRGRTYRFCTLLWLINILVLSSIAAHGQLSTASLNGVVRDQQGAVVIKASVILRNSDNRSRAQQRQQRLGSLCLLGR